MTKAQHNKKFRGKGQFQEHVVLAQSTGKQAELEDEQSVLF